MVEANIDTPIVIVIDALDEVVARKQREEMVEAKAKEMSRFPRFVKVLLTSRDEPDLHAKLDVISLHRSINEVQGTADDIMAYTRNRLQNTIVTGWPTEAELCELGSRADGLFLWIAIASTYILEDLDPKIALNVILSGPHSPPPERTPEAALDQLLRDILGRTPKLFARPDMSSVQF